MSDILIYQSEDGLVQVTISDDTVWLTMQQIADLFIKDKSVISKHLKNIFSEQELDQTSVVAKIATTASDGKKYQVNYYNLDVIIAVGYRVRSDRGAQFRQWASNILKTYLTDGYNLNEQKFSANELQDIKAQILSLSKDINLGESSISVRLESVVATYSKTWDLLLRYDEDRLEAVAPYDDRHISLEYDEAIQAIHVLKNLLFYKNEAGDLFGHERNNGLHAILGNLNQTFDCVALYPSRQEKAAHLIYFIIKDHPFSDGNKRIASLLFLLYLRKAQLNWQLVNNNSLVALAILIAESSPQQKESMINLIINLLL